MPARERVMDLVPVSMASAAPSEIASYASEVSDAPSRDGRSPMDLLMRGPSPQAVPTHQDLLRRQLDTQNGLLVALCERVVGLETRVQGGGQAPAPAQASVLHHPPPAFTRPLDDLLGQQQQQQPVVSPDAASYLNAPSAARPAAFGSLSRTVEGLNGLIGSTLQGSRTGVYPTLPPPPQPTPDPEPRDAPLIAAASDSAGHDGDGEAVMDQAPAVTPGHSMCMSPARHGGGGAASAVPGTVLSQLAAVMAELPEGVPRQRLSSIYAQLNGGAARAPPPAQAGAGEGQSWDQLEADVATWQHKVEALNGLLDNMAGGGGGGRTAPLPTDASLSDQAPTPRCLLPPHAAAGHGVPSAGAINLEEPSKARYLLQAHADRLTEILALDDGPAQGDAPLALAAPPSGLPPPQRPLHAPPGIDSPDPATGPLSPMTARWEEPTSPVASPPQGSARVHRPPLQGTPDRPGPALNPAHMYRPLQRHTPLPTPPPPPQQADDAAQGLRRQVHERLAYLSRHVGAQDAAGGVVPIAEYASSEQIKRVQRFRERRSRQHA